MKAYNMKRAGVLVTMGALAMMALVTGCASQPTEKVEVQADLKRNTTATQDVKGMPDWVVNPGKAGSGDRKHALYAVGDVSSIKNPSLRRKAAEAQARNNMAKRMAVYSASLHKAFSESVTVGGDAGASESAHTSDVLKEVAEQSLVGVEIVEYYERPDINQAYSLARLDLEQVKEMMDKVASSNGQYKQLDAKLREWVKQNAEKANDQLNEELQKKKQN